MRALDYACHPDVMRAWARSVDWDRVRGIFAVLATLFIVGSWLVNPATLPW